MKPEILNRRATLFVGNEPIPINDQTLPKYITAFANHGLYSSINKNLGLKITPQGVVQEDVMTLDLKYLDDTFTVSVNGNRFDMLSVKHEESIYDFMQKVDVVSTIVSSLFPKNYSRYALCTTVVFRLEPNDLDNVYQKVMKTDSEHPIEWQFRKVLRENILDDTTPLFINNAITLSRSLIQNDTNMLEDCIVLDLDVNTVAGSDFETLQQISRQFWDRASDIIGRTLCSYESLISNNE